MFLTSDSLLWFNPSILLRYKIDISGWYRLSTIRLCTVSIEHNQLDTDRLCTRITCSKNGVCNRSGAHLYLCITESCLIACAQSIRCTNDRCSIFPTDTVFSEYGTQLYLCAIEPCPIGRAQSTRCTVGWCTIVSTGSVSSRHGAQLFSCIIGPCPVGCAQSIPCTVVWCSIGTLPIFHPIYIGQRVKESPVCTGGKLRTTICKNGRYCEILLLRISQ